MSFSPGDQIFYLLDLWVVKIKKPMILCAHSMSRLRQHSTKRRTRSKNMWKVCLFYSQNNRIVSIIKHGRHIFLTNSRGAQRYVLLLFLIVLFGCLLAGQTNSNHMALSGLLFLVFMWVMSSHTKLYNFGNIYIFKLQLLCQNYDYCTKPKIGNLTNMTELYPFLESNKWHLLFKGILWWSDLWWKPAIQCGVVFPS